ncbi:FISUMP domain-containing protein [Thalassobellus citreus]|uniref:FISUMP domain-containing protein n=1 Tax=Thalassobellus citreus TaxID=3367752 RepID=UPI003F6E197C
MKQFALILFVLLTTLLGYSQIGIGTVTPDASSALEIASTSQGLLPPRMFYSNMISIVAPAEGLMVYCLDCDPKGLYVYDGSSFLSTLNGSPSGVLSSTGQIWMDRNLGAQQIATAYNDHLSYGDLYQWGRGSDGHQTIVWISSTASDSAEQSNDTETLATTAVPSDGNAWDGKFIKNDSSSKNWLTTPDVTLWQGVTGTNNPCPSGYRIPTQVEFEAEHNNGGTGFWGTGSAQNNRVGAYASVLKLPSVGYRNFDGSLKTLGITGYYWTSTVSGTKMFYLFFNTSNTSYTNVSSAFGLSVRCIKD